MLGRAWQWTGVLALLVAGCTEDAPDPERPAQGGVQERPAPIAGSGAEQLAGPVDAGTAPGPVDDPTLPASCTAFDESGALFCVNGGPAQRERRVIRDAATWEATWHGLMGPRSPTPPVPPVDFAQEMVVLAGMGARTTGGHVIRVTGVTPEAGALRVTVRETTPGPECFTTQALTEPFTAVRVPRTEAAVHFLEEEEVRNCSP